MNNWTGIDLERAYADIMNFNEKSYEAANKMREMFDHFFNDLKNYWASPNAVEYSSRTIRLSLDIYEMFEDKRSQIISNAVIAAQALARANGASFDYQIDCIKDSISYDNYSGCKEVNSDGVTGMVIDLVKNAEATLKKESDIVFDLLNSLPTEISFYDAKGSLVLAHETHIKRFVNYVFKELINDLLYGPDGINVHIDSEISAIEQGQHVAEQILEEAGDFTSSDTGSAGTFV